MMEPEHVVKIIWIAQLYFSLLGFVLCMIFSLSHDNDVIVPLSTHVFAMAFQIALRCMALMPQKYKGRTKLSLALDAGASLWVLFVWDAHRDDLQRATSETFPVVYGSLIVSVALCFVTEGMVLKVVGGFLAHCPPPWLKKYLVLDEEV